MTLYFTWFFEVRKTGSIFERRKDMQYVKEALPGTRLNGFHIKVSHFDFDFSLKMNFFLQISGLWLTKIDFQIYCPLFLLDVHNSSLHNSVLMKAEDSCLWPRWLHCYQQYPPADCQGISVFKDHSESEMNAFEPLARSLVETNFCAIGFISDSRL